MNELDYPPEKLLLRRSEPEARAVLEDWYLERGLTFSLGSFVQLAAYEVLDVYGGDGSGGILLNEYGDGADGLGGGDGHEDKDEEEVEDEDD